MKADTNNSNNSLFSIFIKVSIARFCFFYEKKRDFEKKRCERLAFEGKKEYNIQYYTRIMSPRGAIIKKTEWKLCKKNITLLRTVVK